MSRFTDDQKRVIFERDEKEILVSAGAGAGKTSVLIERIIDMITSPTNIVSIDELLIVTFTKDASKVLKSRLSDALQKKLAKEPTNEQIIRQIYCLSRANISTIHSFCNNVVRRNANVINIDPKARNANEEEIRVIKNEVLEELLNKYYADEEIGQDFKGLVNCFVGKVDDHKFQSMFLDLFDKSRSYINPHNWLLQCVERYNITDYNDFLESLEVKNYIQNIDSLLIKICDLERHYEEAFFGYEKLEKISSSFLDETEYKKVLEDTNIKNKIDGVTKLLNFDRFKARVTTKDEDEKEIYNEFKTSRDILKKRAEQAIENINNYILEEEKIEEVYSDMYKFNKILLMFYDEFSTMYQKAKNEKMIVDMSDLEHFALEVLYDDKENFEFSDIANYYSKKFKEVIVDEYQDCNDIQEAIFKAVSDNGEHMLMVGDVKQSIYRFRGAKPNIFINKYRNENNERLIINLNKNFRSSENILKFVNNIFTVVMKENMGGIEYKRSHELEVGKQSDDKGCVKALLVKSAKNIDKIIKDEENDTEETSGHNGNNLESEAKVIANEIIHLVETSEYEYKDICVLLRTSTDIQVLKDEFDRCNIPYFSKTKENTFNKYEIQAIVNYMKIIDNRLQDIPLISTLKLPMYDFLESELLYLKKKYKSKHLFLCLESFYIENIKNSDETSFVDGLDEDYFDAYEKSIRSIEEDDYSFDITELLQKTKLFLDDYHYFRRIFRKLNISEFIVHLINRTNLDFYLEIYKDGKLVNANISYLLEKAYDFEKSTLKSMFHFIKYLESMEKLDGVATESITLSDDNGDFVKIMTTHNSKGLEFKVVFVSNLSKKFNKTYMQDGYLLEEGVYYKHKNVIKREVSNSLPYINAVAREDNSALAEEIRILYVALTRAEERLYVTVSSDDLEKLEDKYKVIYNDVADADFSSVGSYGELIFPVILNKNNGLCEVIRYDNDEYLIQNEKNQLKEKEAEKNDKKIVYDKYSMFFEYEHEDLMHIPVDISVSKALLLPTIKEGEVVEEEPIIKNNYEKIDLVKMTVGNVNKKLKPNEIGTLYHKVFYLLPFDKKYELEEIEEFIKGLFDKKIISEAEYNTIDAKNIHNFTKTNVYEDIMTSNEVYKEKSFVNGVDGNKIFGEVVDRKIYIKGVIDVFYLINDEIYILDYKTDYITKNNREELLNKFNEQLEYYKNAIEKALNKKVVAKLIYLIKENEIVKL